MLDVLKFNLQHIHPIIPGRSPIDDYMIETKNIWEEWLALDETERVHYKTTFDMLVEPTLALNSKPYNLQFILEMNKYLMDCKKHIIEIEHILMRGYLTFKNHNFNYRSTRKILGKCIEILK